MNKFFESHVGRIIISIIWGFGLATFFKKTCTNNKCIVIKQPGVNNIEGKTYSYEGVEGCYKFKPELKKCTNQ